MNQAPWRVPEASINKAASTDLVVGKPETASSFRPRDSVSLSDPASWRMAADAQTGKARRMTA